MTTQDSPFTTLPHDILIDILLPIPTSSVINFYVASKAHLELFDTDHGLWELLARRIFHWGASALPSTQDGKGINWKKEYRVASYFQSALQNGRMQLYSSRKNPPIEFITDNYIKSDAIPDAITNGECVSFSTPFCARSNFDQCLQHDTKLYPLPIGNFTTAYYEVQLLTDNLLDGQDLVVGGALSGFIGYVGSGILSYGYASHGAIYLECDIAPFEEQEMMIENGDVVGFGIDFSNQSVFFTKNGKVIYEANKNFKDEPLLELKNLHATITINKNDIIVNRGSSPFVFDLLKYQHQHASNKPLELYSNVVVQHLVSEYELNESIIEQRYGGRNSYFGDHNIPNFPCELPDMFYQLLYGVSKSQNTSLHFDEQDMGVFDLSRMLLNSSTVLLNMTTNQTRGAKILVDGACQILQLEDKVKSLSWEDKCTIMLNSLMEVQYNGIANMLLKPYADEIASHIFQYMSSLPCFPYLLAAVEFFCAERPEVENGALYWSKEIALRALLDEGEGLEEAAIRLLGDLSFIRVKYVLVSVLAQRCEDLEKKKAKELNNIKLVFCGDKDQSLRRAYTTLLQSLTKRSEENPFDYMKFMPKVVSPVMLIQIHCQALAFLTEKEFKVNELLFYGIYQLKLSPNDFASAEEFVREVQKQNEELITDEVKREYLELVKRSIKRFTEEAIRVEAIGPLKFVFGTKLKLDGSSIEEWQQELERKINHMLETKNYGKMVRVRSNKSKSIKRAQSVSNTSLIVIGAVVAVSVVGAFLWRKRFSK